MFRLPAPDLRGMAASASKGSRRTRRRGPGRRSHTRMDAIGGNASTLQPPGQLIGELNHGQLRLVVRPDTAVSLFALEVVEVYGARALPRRGDVNDPGGALALSTSTSRFVNRKGAR